MFPLVYWNAAAAMFAYAFGNVAVLGLDVLGESQLVGYPQVRRQSLLSALRNVNSLTLQLGSLPPQFPSVAMLNWTTGAGTARYWVLDLLLQQTTKGDALVASSTTPQAEVPMASYH
jgi:hypothetical protein